MIREYLANVNHSAWIESPNVVAGKPITRHQRLIEDGEDGPEASISTRTNGYAPPHLHPAAQFQLVVSGTSRYPTYEIPAVGVHYTDHCVPYGPFDTSPDYCHFVLHTKPGSQVLMTNKSVRGKTNRTGRDIIAADKDFPWTPFPGHPNARRKLLIDIPSGVRAELVECSPGMEMATGSAPHGRYEIVLKGLVSVSGRTLEQHGLRFVIGEESPKPLLVGPQGATVVLLEYDQDADRTYIKEFSLS